jgi:hypothetical protein
MKAIFNNLRPRFRRALQIRRRRGIHRLLVLSGLAVSVAAAAVHAQKNHTPPPNGRMFHRNARTATTGSRSAPAAQGKMPDHLPPPPLTPEQTEPNPPHVSYEGGQLTIIAENSDLSDVLSLLSARTGADINFPSSAAHQRIWVGLGPAPAQKVLAALLSEIGLDYAIQASDIDPQGVRRVFLRARTKPATERPPGQENLPAQESDTASELAPEDLRSAPAKLQPSREIRDPLVNDPATSPEEPPAETQTSPEGPFGIVTNQTPFDGMPVADPNPNFAEDPPLAVYTGQLGVVGGMTLGVVVYSSGGVLVIVWNDAEDKLLGIPRAIFIGDPSGLRHNFEPSNRK